MDALDVRIRPMRSRNAPRRSTTLRHCTRSLSKWAPITLLVGVLELVERSVLCVEQLAVAPEEPLVQVLGVGHRHLLVTRGTATVPLLGPYPSPNRLSGDPAEVLVRRSFDGRERFAERETLLVDGPPHDHALEPAITDHDLGQRPEVGQCPDAAARDHRYGRRLQHCP